MKKHGEEFFRIGEVTKIMGTPRKTLSPARLIRGSLTHRKKDTTFCRVLFVCVGALARNQNISLLMRSISAQTLS